MPTGTHRRGDRRRPGPRPRCAACSRRSRTAGTAPCTAGSRASDQGHGSRLARVAAGRARRAVGGPHRHAAAARRDPGRARGDARDAPSAGTASAGSSPVGSIPTTGAWSARTPSASATCRSRPSGTAESVRASGCWRWRDRCPDRLTIQLGTLVTRVLLDDRRRAYGVEFRRGARLYRAHVAPSAEAGELGEAYAAREVILSAARSTRRSC